MNQIQTHYYDTQLKDIYKKYVEIQNTTTDFFTYSWIIQDTINEILENLYKINLKIEIKNGIQIICNLILHDKAHNYDSLNDIHTYDILFRTWYYIRKLSLEDQIPFYIQLYEIKDGTCAQGRTTRLFQIYSTFF